MHFRADLSLPKIDVHAHVPADHQDSCDFLEAMGIRLLNISIALVSMGKLRTEGVWHAQPFQRMAKRWPERMAWSTTFDLPRFDDPDYIDAVIEGLTRDFEDNGAVACKVWRNIGADVVKPDGSYLLID